MWICCRGFAKILEDASEKIGPRAIDDLCDAVEARISEKVRSDFRSELEMMKNEVMRAIVGVLRNVGTEDGYEEAPEDFEVAGSSGEDKIDHVERPIGTRSGQFARPGS